MAEAENQIRKAHKRSSGTDRLANAARLGALEKNIGVPMKRHRNPDDLPDHEKTTEDHDETVFLLSE